MENLTLFQSLETQGCTGIRQQVLVYQVPNSSVDRKTLRENSKHNIAQ
jgi:hypothetical protein